jgi:hypothetical protein
MIKRSRYRKTHGPEWKHNNEWNLRNMRIEPEISEGSRKTCPAVGTSHLAQ